MINRVVLVGRITKDIEIRKTNSNLSVTSFSLAVDNTRKDENGNKTTSFINCNAFGNSADILGNYTHKGSLVGVEGRLQQRKFDRKDGTSASVIEVVVDNVTLLEPKGSNSQQTSSVNVEPTVSIDIPSINETSDVTSSELTDDDLPF